MMDGALCDETSLPEKLRKQQVVVTTKCSPEEKRKKMELIILHQSEFPGKIRETITLAAGASAVGSDPEDFLGCVYNRVKQFFLGVSPGVHLSDNDDNGTSNHEWHGLDSDVDTEEQAETAVRFFPQVLRDKMETRSLHQLKTSHPVYCSLMSLKASFFIPLLAQLGTELDIFGKDERGGLTVFFRNVLVRLSLYNTLEKSWNDEQHPEKVDETFLEVLMRLKKRGLLTFQDADHSLIWTLSQQEPRHTRARLRFFLDWNPTSLVDTGRGTPLLYEFLRNLSIKPREKGASYLDDKYQRFVAIFEHGMSHFPEKLGFLFYRDSFQLACRAFRFTKSAQQVLDDTLWNRILEQGDQLRFIQILFVATASNAEISLDGLFLIVRREPGVAMPPPSHDSF